MIVSKEILDIFHKWGENLSNIEFYLELKKQILLEHHYECYNRIADGMNDHARRQAEKKEEEKL